MPESLFGDLILESASCRDCAVITGKFEGRYTGETIKPFRDFWKYPSKRTNKKRLSSFPMKLHRNNEIIEINVSKDDYIPIIPLWELGHPEKFAHFPNVNGLKHGEARLIVFRTKNDVEVDEIRKRLNGDDISVEFKIYLNDFLRMIAKIGYCFAVAKYGLSQIKENYVLDGILGKSNDLFRWVGSEGKQLLFEDAKSIDAQHFVTAGLDPDGTIGVKIKLFKNIETPEYIVLVGTVSDRYLAIMKCAGYPLGA